MTDHFVGSGYPSNAGERTLSQNISNNHSFCVTRFQQSITRIALPDPRLKRKSERQADGVQSAEAIAHADARDGQQPELPGRLGPKRDAEFVLIVQPERAARQAGEVGGGEKVIMNKKAPGQAHSPWEHFQFFFL